MNKASLILTGITIFLTTAAAAYLGFIVAGVIRQQRSFKNFRWPGTFLAGLLFLLPLLAGIYLLPQVMTPMAPDEATVPLELWAAGSLIFCYLVFFIGHFFPHRNKYYNPGAKLVFISLLPSMANAGIIFIITTYLNSNGDKLYYLVFYFVLCVYLYVATNKIIKEQVLDISKTVILDLNKLIISKVFNTSFRDFEKIRKGSLFAVLNEDIERITVFCNNAVNLYTAGITVILVLIYLLTINPWAVLLLFVVLAVILSIHYSMGIKTAKHFHRASELREVYMDQLLGLSNGFRELIMHQVKRRDYRQELDASCTNYNEVIHQAYKKYINRTMVSDMAFILSIGISCFLLPAIFHLDMKVVTAYIMGALFLWGPLNMIVKSVPEVVGIKVAWKRIQQFMGANSINSEEAMRQLIEQDSFIIEKYSNREVDSITAEEVLFEYSSEQAPDEKYFVGPLNFEARKGEITFVVGGNGSGKTTLAKLLAGLYMPGRGKVKINGKVVPGRELGEYFSVIFSDFYLFRKVYTETGVSKKNTEALISLFRLNGKVTVDNNTFSTLNLSRGQTKRLALLQCWLENRPIFLFDECAADQDPEFKEFFYLELLPRMKQQQKIVIVITHDDRYFNVADSIFKMEMGQLVCLNDKVM